MDKDKFSISLQEKNGFKIWEMDDIPRPNEVSCGTALYRGQKNVEGLLRVVNHKAFINHMDRFIDPLFSIIEDCLKQGVEENGTVQWDDSSHYIKVSWIGYSWKLPNEIKRRMVQIDIRKTEGKFAEGKIRIPLKKVAEDGSVILIPPKLVSKMNLRNGNAVSVGIRFCQ